MGRAWGFYPREEGEQTAQGEQNLVPIFHSPHHCLLHSPKAPCSWKSLGAAQAPLGCGLSLPVWNPSTSADQLGTLSLTLCLSLLIRKMGLIKIAVLEIIDSINNSQLLKSTIVATVCYFSCVQCFATLWTVACQAPLSMGFSKQEYWSRLPWPTPGDLPDPGIKPASLRSPTLAGSPSKRYMKRQKN